MTDIIHPFSLYEILTQEEDPNTNVERVGIPWRAAITPNIKPKLKTSSLIPMALQRPVQLCWGCRSIEPGTLRWFATVACYVLLSSLHGYHYGYPAPTTPRIHDTNFPLGTTFEHSHHCPKSRESQASKRSSRALNTLCACKYWLTFINCNKLSYSSFKTRQSTAASTLHCSSSPPYSSRPDRTHYTQELFYFLP